MICSPISWHLRGGMARVGGASFQPLHLLRPRHRQRAGRSVGTVVQLNGDGLDPAHGLVAVAAAKFQVSGGNGRNFKFELMNCCPSDWHICSHLAQIGHLACRIVLRTGSLTVTQVGPRVRRADSDSLSVWLSLTPAVTDRWQLCTSVVCLSSCTSLHER